MKKVLGVIVAIVIIWIAGVISTLLKAIVKVSRADIVDISQFQFILMGLIPFIPFIIAIWLVKLSWRKITYKKPEQVLSNNKNDTSLSKAVYNHTKDIASEVKPTINGYKEKHQTSKSDISNISSMNEDEVYEKVMLEIEEDNKVKSTWAKSLAQSDGDKDKAESIYIKMRVNVLMKEQKDTSSQALNLISELNENSINLEIDSDNTKAVEQYKNIKSKFDSAKEKYLKDYENRKAGKLYEEEPAPVGLFSYIKLIFKV